MGEIALENLQAERRGSRRRRRSYRLLTMIERPDCVFVPWTAQVKARYAGCWDSWSLDSTPSQTRPVNTPVTFLVGKSRPSVELAGRRRSGGSRPNFAGNEIMTLLGLFGCAHKHMPAPRTLNRCFNVHLQAPQLGLATILIQFIQPHVNLALLSTPRRRLDILSTIKRYDDCLSQRQRKRLDDTSFTPVFPPQ